MTHSFLGVFLSRQAAGILHDMQSTLRRSDGYEAIPKRLLHLTLDDLGSVPREALEAATLACRRVLSGHAPFTIRSRELVQLGPLVALTFDDPKGRLAALRAAFHQGLAGYGFALDDRPFRPHVTLGRGALPSVPPPAPSVSLRVAIISLMRHAAPDEPGLPWRVEWEGELDDPTAAQPASPDPIDQDAAIRALLEARLEARAAKRAAVERAQAAPKTTTDPSPRAKRRRRRRGGRSNAQRKSS